jgi:hypothetical protein
MKSVWKKLHKISSVLHLPDMPNWLVGILALILILRIPSFFEPYYYGDEMVYLTLGQGIHQGLTLYKDIHDNKPPLIYLAAAIAGNLFWFKVILAFWNLATIYIFYRLSEKLFAGKVRTQKISTLIFALLTTLPLLEGNTANAELFMIGPSILAILLLLNEKLKTKKVFLAGILFGIATLFKVPAALDLPVIIIFWLITKNLRSSWKEILKNSLVIAAGFVLPILLTFIWYLAKGALPEYIKAAFLQNIGYLSSFRPGDVQKPFFVRNGPLLIRAVIVVAASTILYVFRKRLSKNFVLFSVWTFLALFAVTLSERPYPHYFIQAVAPISLLLAMLLSEKNIEQSLAIIPLTVAFLVPVFYKFYYYPTTSYYTRFIEFATKKINKQTYFNMFSANVNRNYELANFLVNSSLPSDKVFMWDPDSAAVYALSRRLPPIKYVVPYHVHDYSSTLEVAKEVENTPPKFIILTSGNPYPELTNLIRSRYLLIQEIGNASIYSKINLAPER